MLISCSSAAFFEQRVWCSDTTRFWATLVAFTVPHAERVSVNDLERATLVAFTVSHAERVSVNHILLIWKGKVKKKLRCFVGRPRCAPLRHVRRHK